MVGRLSKYYSEVSRKGKTDESLLFVNLLVFGSRLSKSPSDLRRLFPTVRDFLSRSGRLVTSEVTCFRSRLHSVEQKSVASAAVTSDLPSNERWQPAHRKQVGVACHVRPPRVT